MLDLTFSDEQEMLRETVRGVCATTCPLSVVRQLEDDPVGFAPELWKQLAHLDLIGLQLPEEFGGSGMSVLEGVVVYEEFGRSLAPSPHFVSAVLCGTALASAGDDELKRSWLPRIVTGETIVTPAWLEPEGGFGPAGVQVRARRDGDGFVISGTKRHVAFAGSASRLVVLARTSDADADIDLFLVDPAADGVTLTQQLSIASDTQFQVDLDNVRVTADDRIGAAGSGWSTWDAVMQEGVDPGRGPGRGWRQVRARDHRAVRQRPPPVRQAPRRFPGAGALPGGRCHQRSTAPRCSSTRRPGPGPREETWTGWRPMAKLHACRTFRDLTATAQQIFGGIGFTVEFDIQLFFRRAKQLQLSWWDSRYLEERIAAAVLD